MRGQKGSDHLPIEMTILFPKEYTFYRKQTKPPQTQINTYQTYTQLLNHNKLTDIHPLLFRGNQYRSAFVTGVIENCTRETILTFTNNQRALHKRKKNNDHTIKHNNSYMR